MSVFSKLKIPSGNMEQQEGIWLPEGYDETVYQNETAIARWCLNHKPEKRPTAEELLKVCFTVVCTRH